MFSFGIRSCLFVKLFPLCYTCTPRLVVVAAASQVGLLRDSSFDVLHVRMHSIMQYFMFAYDRVYIAQVKEDAVSTK